MKRKFLLLTVTAAAAALLLTACSSKSGQQTAAGTTSGQQNTAGTTSDQQPSAGTTSDQQAAAGTAANQQNSSGNEDTADIPAADSGEVQEPAGSDVAASPDDSEAGSDLWSGFYNSGTESVDIALLSEDTISFSFAQSGISGTATVNGNQAVYKGDDYHVVVFNLSGDVMDISVSSEEDFDASESPLNGSYTRG